MALVLEDVDVIIAGAVDPASIAGLGFGTAPTVESALSTLADNNGPIQRSLLVAPYALQTLPIVDTQENLAVESHRLS